MEPNQLSKAEKVAAKKAGKLARRAHRKAVADALDAGLEPPAMMNKDAAVSVAHRSLPLPPRNLAANATTICLCYQYKEPAWTKKQHKHAITKITDLAKLHNITGRGRCAPEGLNCTLTASASNMRMFCYALRDWNLLFHETDFKLSDGEPASALFRTFTLRKVTELVGYGLGGVKAPSLSRHAGKHLEAVQYHEQMKKKDTVIIDVRNAYESAIGHFQPPVGGAMLLDPKMRDSTDFPKWLNLPETKEKLNGKTVMMYCTGGIRCERATALLNQMTEAEEEDGSFQTKDVVMARGGIERYLKTFPEGGYWKGKNYLFDKRMEQVPLLKNNDLLEKDVESYCCVCHVSHASYRGQFKCNRDSSFCSVPVIVCPQCTRLLKDEKEREKQRAKRRRKEEATLCDPYDVRGSGEVEEEEEERIMLTCPLCEAGHLRPTTSPDLVGQKRKLGVIENGGRDTVSGVLLTTSRQERREEMKIPSQRLFIGRLPLTITASTLRAALFYASRGGMEEDEVGDDDDDEAMRVVVEHVHWIVDHTSGAFFGSAFVWLSTVEAAQRIVSKCHGVKRMGENEEKEEQAMLVLSSSVASARRRERAARRRRSEEHGDGAQRRRKKRKRQRRVPKVTFAPLVENVVWPIVGNKETEYPPR